MTPVVIATVNKRHQAIEPKVRPIPACRSTASIAMNTTNPTP
jgi:hypothetical protein